jgi:hypothetical protein
MERPRDSLVVGRGDGVDHPVDDIKAGMGAPVLLPPSTPPVVATAPEEVGPFDALAT